MAFDKPTRNRLASFVSDARRVITEEFTQQFQSLYGISEKGDLTPLGQLGHLDDTGLATAAMLRERIGYLVKTHPDDKDSTRPAVARLAREQAFTVLNRLAAIRMAEKRDLVVESVGNGYQSKGFKVFEQVAGSGLGDIYHRYRRYLFCLFDEMAVDLGLFDRRSPQGLLFPREPALQEFLTLLNASDLDGLWAEDETIGWIYQYYNDPAERKKMRDESAAPRNSRELAVRNQFFTPRYVVEFLTDNTLGRIWYEMSQGQTRLKDQCRYLVRRPTEIFLNPGEVAPETPPQDGVSQEELLKQPVHIPHCPIKDPREIRMLDPACGSMHFGLYALDLFEVIYEEAWDLGMESLRRDFPDKDVFLREVPRLIIEHNIHGIDIDPRAVQIAGLSLWLRAQKSWQAQRVPAAQRPRILRSNIVCAEPMPGSPELLREFTVTLNPPLLGQLVEKIFAHMQLAGEAGSLLKIEEEIASLVKDAKKLWQSGPQAVQLELGFALKTEPKQGNLPLDISGISDDRFWKTAEEHIYAALRSYAEHAESGGYQRRLFAEDAARGFAFIDLCRKRYDVVLMNPPFGEPSEELLEHLSGRFVDINKNLLCAFLIRGFEMLSLPGRLGAIYDRTAIVKNTYEAFRRSFLVGDCRLAAQADLGWEVLDANVEVTTSVMGKNSGRHRAAFFNVRKESPEVKGETLLAAIRKAAEVDGITSSKLFEGTEFSHFPNAVLGYDFPEFAVRLFATTPNFEERGVQVLQGHTILSDRFFRYWWEVPLTEAFLQNSRWRRFYNGGEYCRFNSSLSDAVLYGDNGELIIDHPSTILRNPELQKKGKIGFGKRGDFIDAHILPVGFVSSVEGQAVVFHNKADPLVTLALLNSHIFQSIINLYCGQHKYPGYVHLFPCPDWSSEALKEARSAAIEIFKLKDTVEGADETNPRFLHNATLAVWNPCFHESIAVINTSITTAELYLNRQVEQAYSLDESAKKFIAEANAKEPATGGWISEDTKRFWAESLFFYGIGAPFGRWDIRHATGEEPTPDLPDPFAALPVCPPGMLQNADGLPAESKDVPTKYPLRISWPGILVEDENHPEDIVARVREALEVIWKDRAEAIEHEACELLGVKSLGDYLRRPAGFFADHLKRYSKSRRQAPIYWPLSSAKGSYTLWIYYHRLSDQILHTALADFVDPKLRSVRAEISSLHESATHRDRLEELQDLESELEDFRTEIERIIKLPWKPNLNDGVLITASPLWKLFRLPKWQKDLKACWEKLEKGGYDWAHLAHSIWPNRVEEVCKHDRSIAIAHNLENLCKIEPPKPNARRAKKQLI